MEEGWKVMVWKEKIRTQIDVREPEFDFEKNRKEIKKRWDVGCGIDR